MSGSRRQTSNISKGQSRSPVFYHAEHRSGIGPTALTEKPHLSVTKSLRKGHIFRAATEDLVKIQKILAAMEIEKHEVLENLATDFVSQSNLNKDIMILDTIIRTTDESSSILKDINNKINNFINKR